MGHAGLRDQTNNPLAQRHQKILQTGQLIPRAVIGQLEPDAATLLVQQSQRAGLRSKNFDGVLHQQPWDLLYIQGA